MITRAYSLAVNQPDNIRGNSSSWINKLEWIVSIVLILYFADVGFPNPLSRLLNYSSYLIVPILVTIHIRKAIYIAVQDKILLLLTIIVIASISWSAVPSWSFGEVRHFVRASLFAVYLSTRYSLEDLIRLLAWSFGLIAFFSILNAIILPGSGVDHGVHAGAWKGIFKHKNHLARMMTFSSIFFIMASISIHQYRRLLLLCLGLSMLALIASQGKTALAIFVLSLCLLTTYRLIHLGYKTQTFLWSFSILSALSTIVLAVSNLEFIIVDLLGKNLSFSGRFPLWQVLIERVMTRPWLGFGYNAFWKERSELSYVVNSTWLSSDILSGSSTMHAHSGYIDLFLSLGFLGIIIFSISLVFLVVRLFNLIRLEPSMAHFGMLIFIVMNLMFNYSITRSIVSADFLWILHIFIAINATLRLKGIKRLNLDTPQVASQI